MKKAILIFTVISTFALFSCGGGSGSSSSSKDAAQAEKTEKAAPATKQEKEENIYVKDKYLADLELTAKENKYSQEEWDRISKTCNAYGEFEKSIKNGIPTKEEFETFFKEQGYKDYEAGKDEILKFAELYQTVVSLPIDFGSQGTIKKLYGEEKYKESCKNLSEQYNELGLSAGDLKNIEKYSKVISEAKLVKIGIESSESLNK